MKNLPIDWNSVPDVMNKDQFYRLCHISKSTALHLLKSGKVPCEWSGKKTRCYKIKKEDVRAYLEERAVYPELYSAPRGWYGGHYVAKLSKELPEDVLQQMHDYYAKLLSKYKDVVTVQDVVALTGYAKTTINNWCNRGELKSFRKGQLFYIPKIFLIDFFCSLTFRSITRKSLWHIQTLNDFQRKINIYLIFTIGSFKFCVVSYLEILQSFLLGISIQKVITILFKFYRRQIANTLMFHKTA